MTDSIACETTVRRATAADLIYVDSLRKKEASALGFITKQCYEHIVDPNCVGVRRCGDGASLFVTEDNGDLTGFCYSSFNAGLMSIFQIVVQEDARRWHRASLLLDAVESEAARLNAERIKARVAIDLESNHFWRAMGFVPVAITNGTFLNQREAKRKRPIAVYIKDRGPTLFDLNEIAVSLDQPRILVAS